MGARVVVCEVDPLRALEAVMEGYQALAVERLAAAEPFAPGVHPLPGR